MTGEELAARRPVWDAMSELFLDTEVRPSVPWVAVVCAHSPYDAAALDGIFRGEVFPLAIGNLLQVAGEWAGLALDEAELVRRAGQPRAPWLAAGLMGWMVEDEWTAVLELVARLRAVPPERWTALQRLWGLCLRRYFHGPPLAPDPAPLAGLEGLDLAQEWQALEPVARGMLSTRERPDAADRAAVVEALLFAGQDGALPG